MSISDSLRASVRREKDPERKLIARAAIKGFDQIQKGVGAEEDCLEALHTAATHSHITVYETGFSFLSELVPTSRAAQETLIQLARHSKWSVRRRSVQYVKFTWPREFCVQLVRQLLVDRSSSVRAFAGFRASNLNLTELQADLDHAVSVEQKESTRRELELSALMLRDGYYLYDDAAGFGVAFRHIQDGSSSTSYVSFVDGARLTREKFEELGFDYIRLQNLHQSNRDPNPPDPWGHSR